MQWWAKNVTFKSTCIFEKWRYAAVRYGSVRYGDASGINSIEILYLNLFIFQKIKENLVCFKFLSFFTTLPLPRKTWELPSLFHRSATDIMSLLVEFFWKGFFLFKFFENTKPSILYVVCINLWLYTVLKILI